MSLSSQLQLVLNPAMPNDVAPGSSSSVSPEAAPPHLQLPFRQTGRIAAASLPLSFIGTAESKIETSNLSVQVADEVLGRSNSKSTTRWRGIQGIPDFSPAMRGQVVRDRCLG